MEATCSSCSTKLMIPDEQLPKDVETVQVECPSCNQATEIRLAKSGAPAQPAAETSPEPVAPLVEDHFEKDGRLAMSCFEDPKSQYLVETALKSLGYTVHTPAKPADSVQLIKKNKYEVVLFHEEYGGSAEKNPVLKAIQPMAMNFRRHICVGLVGKKFKTWDNMTAFAKSVNFVAAEQELDKIQAITLRAVTENDQFYSIFRETVRDAGKS